MVLNGLTEDTDLCLSYIKNRFKIYLININVKWIKIQLII